jgi:hypothetical protein
VPFSCSTTEQPISAVNHMFCDQHKEIISLFRKFITHVINRDRPGASGYTIAFSGESVVVSPIKPIKHKKDISN